MPTPDPYDPVPDNPPTPLNPPGVPHSNVPPMVPLPPSPPLVIQRYYSPSTRGFYSNEPNAAPLPPDTVPITAALWQQLLTDNAAGKDIVFDAGTQLPIAVVPPVTVEHIRSQFQSRMRRTDWTQLSDTPPQIRNAFQNYRDNLRQIMVNLPPNLANVVWPAVPVINNPLFKRDF